MPQYSQEVLSAIDAPASLTADIQEMRDAIGRLKRGELADEEFRRFRLHRGIYGQRADQPGFNMIRVKVPYGLLSSGQLHQLGEVARKFADGLAHVTTRQDIQFHWVRLENVPEAMELLAAVGLTTREACGNTVRNIVGSPLAGVSIKELFDVTPYAYSLAKHLLRNQLNQKLPRKFKISFSGSSDESDGIIPWIHDLGFVAALRDDNGTPQKGFTVFVGGGLGAQPRVADVFEEFLPAEGLIPTTEAILAVFNAAGNRENRNKARIKYVLWKLGLDEFRRRVGEERARILQSNGSHAIPDDEPVEISRFSVGDTSVRPANEDVQFGRWVDSNVIPQKQEGHNVVYVNPTIGDLTTDQLFALSTLADQFSDGFVRTTAQQDVIFRWVKTSELNTLYRELGRIGLQQPGAQNIANVTSCPGADTCNLGITHSRALGKELTQLFQRNPDWSELLKDLRVKISGCPNSCGQHHVASIGLHGATKHVDGKEIPSYILSIGGGMNSGKPVFGDTIGRIPAINVVEGVSRIVRSFLTERTESEDFWHYVERRGVYAFRSSLKDLTDIRPEDIREELFVDLGEKDAFNAKTGEGECAV